MSRGVNYKFFTSFESVFIVVLDFCDTLLPFDDRFEPLNPAHRPHIPKQKWCSFHHAKIMAE